MHGSFGYKLGRKTRLMHVEYDADILWQTCVREIYLLMKQFGSMDLFKEAFEQLLVVKDSSSIKPEDIDKCRPYTNVSCINKQPIHWRELTTYCQHSYINLLDSGYFLNNGEKAGYIFLLDFNTFSVRFYSIINNKEKEYATATIDDIMEFEDMPSKTSMEILTEMKERHRPFYERIQCINEEIAKIRAMIERAKELRDQNILQQTTYLLANQLSNLRDIEEEYQYFYHRLNCLQLID